MTTRSNRVSPSAPPIVPDYGTTDLVTQPRIEELNTEVRKLRAELAYAKRKHERIEDALSRHIGNIEKTVTTFKEAISLLGKSLLPTERT